MLNLSTEFCLSSRKSGGCLNPQKNLEKKPPERVNVSIYGKKLAAIFYKKEKTNRVSFVKDDVHHTRSATHCVQEKDLATEIVRLKKLACAMHNLITQSKMTDTSEGNANLSLKQSFKAMPPTASVQEKYEDLPNGVDNLVKKESSSTLLNEVVTKKKKIKKKRSKRQQMIKIPCDCICNSAFYRRKSYKPKWNNSIGPELDTAKYYKNKCVQSGKYLTTEQMIIWNDEIRKRKGLEVTCSTSSEINNNTDAAVNTDDPNDKCRKSTENAQKNVSTNTCRCLSRKIQCERVSVDEQEKPSSKSGSLQSNEMPKRESVQSNDTPKRESVQSNEMPKRISTKMENCSGESRESKQRRSSGTNREQKRRRSSSTKRHENCKNKAVKKIISSDAEDICRLRENLFEILDKILKRKRKRMQENLPTDLEKNVNKKLESEKPKTVKCTKIKCPHIRYPTNYKRMESMKC